MKRQIKIGQVLGIQRGLHFGWLAIAVLVRPRWADIQLKHALKMKPESAPMEKRSRRP